MNSDTNISGLNSDAEYLSYNSSKAIKNIDVLLENINYLDTGVLNQKSGWFYRFHTHLPKFKTDIKLPTPSNITYTDESNILRQILREELEYFKLYIQLVNSGNTIEEDVDDWFRPAINELDRVNHPRFQDAIKIAKQGEHIQSRARECIDNFNI